MDQSTQSVTAPSQAVCDFNRCILALDLATTTGCLPADDNEADAVALLLWVLETNGGLR